MGGWVPTTSHSYGKSPSPETRNPRLKPRADLRDRVRGGCVQLAWGADQKSEWTLGYGI